MRRLIVIAVLLPGALARAQTADPVFTEATWNLQARGPRITGLGGAFVTSTRGSQALPLSPAAAFTSRQDASISFVDRPGLGFMRWQGEITGGIELAWGGRLEKGYERAFMGNSARLTDSGTIDSGRVSFDSYDMTLGAALHWRRGVVGVTAGVGFTGALLNIDGTYESLDVATMEETRITYTGDPVGLTTVGSLLVEIGHEYTDSGIRLGVAARAPIVEWQFERSSLQISNGQVGPVDDSGRKYDLRMPSSWSIGAEAWFSRLRVLGQADFVDYDDVTELFPLTPDEPSFGFSAGRRYDYSLAVELAVTGWLRVRGGYRDEVEHKLKRNPELRSNPHRQVGFGGVTFLKDLLGRTFQIDLDFGGDISELAIGLSVEL